MKNSFLRIAVLLLTVNVLLFPEASSVKIGECSWFTGQNRFEDILAIAKEKTKPVLVFYSASWCGPCQRVINKVLTAKKFRKVEKEAVLLFVEYTKKGGKKLIEKHRIIQYPTLKLFSSGGIDLDTNVPDESLSTILRWVMEVKRREELIKRLGKTPGDWEMLLQATEKIKETMQSADQYEQSITLLRNAIKAGGPDPHNLQKAQERLAHYLYLTMTAKKGKHRRKYALEHKEEFTHIIRTHYPDRFGFELKEKNALSMWIDWLTTVGDYKTAVRVFEESRTRQAGPLAAYTNINLLESIIEAYLAVDRKKQAMMWISRIDSAFTANHKKGKLDAPPLTYIRILLNIIDHKYNEGNQEVAKPYIANLQTVLTVTGKQIDGKTLYKYFPDFEKAIEFFYRKNIRAEVEKIAVILKGMTDSFRDDTLKTFITIRMAKRYGVFVDEALRLLSHRKRGLPPRLDTFTIAGKAVLLSKKGKLQEARRLIDRMYQKIKQNKNLNDTSCSRALNTLAWATFEMNAVDKGSIQMAKESVLLDRTYRNLDTLATIYAELGNYREAIRMGQEALGLVIREEPREMLEEKLAQWGNMVE